MNRLYCTCEHELQWTLLTNLTSCFSRSVYCHFDGFTVGENLRREGGHVDSQCETFT